MKAAEEVIILFLLDLFRGFRENNVTGVGGKRNRKEARVGWLKGGES